MKMPEQLYPSKLQLSLFIIKCKWNQIFSFPQFSVKQLLFKKDFFLIDPIKDGILKQIFKCTQKVLQHYFSKLYFLNFSFSDILHVNDSSMPAL